MCALKQKLCCCQHDLTHFDNLLAALKLCRNRRFIIISISVSELDNLSSEIPQFLRLLKISGTFFFNYFIFHSVSCDFYLEINTDCLKLEFNLNVSFAETGWWRVRLISLTLCYVISCALLSSSQWLCIFLCPVNQAMRYSSLKVSLWLFHFLPTLKPVTLYKKWNIANTVSRKYEM